MMTMTAFLGALELGTIYGILALGVFISFRTLNMPDLTVDGSIVTGMAVTAVMCSTGVHPALALIGSVIGGAAVGLLTGILHTKVKIQPILAGILVMLGSYSINLRIMGKTPNIPLTQVDTIYKMADRIMPPKFAGIILGVVILAVVIGAIYAFLQTRIGFIFRATGDNEDMVRSCGMSVDSMKLLGLGLSNGLVGLAGGMLAQNQAFADIGGGTGMMVIGLASVILGEVVFGTNGLLRRLTAASLGAVLYRVIISQALYLGMDSNDLKLVSAAIVAAALGLGILGEKGAKISKISKRRVKNEKAA